MRSAIYCCLLLLAINFTVYGQEHKLNIQSVQISFKGHGGISYSEYGNNIVKLTFSPTPKSWRTRKNISDAVIAVSTPFSYKFKNRFQADDTSFIISGRDNFRISNVFSDSNYAGFKFRLGKNTKVFGGGERALPLNRRGYRFNFYNNPWYGYAEGADNLNYSVPFLTTSDGYGLFFDNPGKGYADIGKSDSDILEVGFSGGEINVYVIFGNDYKEILSGYNRLTGTQPLPPRWAFGNLMSRFGYTSQAQATNILAKMRSENIPVDAVIFDLFWFGDSIKGTMGNLDWVNKTKWPDPKKMMSDFKKQNVQTILITEPFVVKSSSNYDNAKNFFAVDSAGKPYMICDFYFGAAGLIDIFRKDAQDWFWSRHKPQMENGVEAWWGDLGEPEKHPANLYHNLKDLGFNKLFKADEVHNLYGHTWTKMLYQKYAEDYPNKRLFSLNRSGFAGTQRYGIFPWSGDVSRGWSGLRAQLPVMLGMSMSGVPYIHADAGGFAGGEGDNELYIRWLQFAAFTPIFRPHGTALYEADTAAFSFPSEAALIAEPYKTYAKEVINLRYKLLPYNYTLAYKQATNGTPLVAPFYYYYPTDTTAINISDEYMWGENILVAPILQKGTVERKLYLPQGNNWYKFNGPLPIEGGKWVTEDTSTIDKSTPWIAYLPSYFKAGSFIALSNENYKAGTGDYANGDLIIQYYYDPKSSQQTVYEDDGHSKDVIVKRNFQLLNFEATPTGKDLKIEVTCAGQDCLKQTGRNLFFNIVGFDFHGKKYDVFVNGKLTKKIYAGNSFFSVILKNEPLNIEIKE